MGHTWRLFRLTQGFRWQLVWAGLLGLTASAAGIGRLALSGYALALVFQGQPLTAVFWPIAGVAACILLRAALEYSREVVGNRTAGQIKLNLREHLYQHVLTLGPGYFDQKRTGDVVMSLVEGVEQLETFFGQYFPQFAVALLTPPLIFAFMAAFDVQTAFIFLAFALFTLILPLLTTTWTGESSLKRRQAYSALGAEFLDAVQSVQEPPQPAIPASEALSLEPEVRFEGVSFGYPNRPQVLKRISLTIQPGEQVGLVGPSGAGKSTMIWLLLRFFDPQQGQIRIGGH